MRSMTAVDLGAQSGRVAVGRFDGERLEMEVVHRFANQPVRVRGTLHWDILGLYREVLDGLRAAGPTDSLGVDSWAVDFGLLDRRGRLLANPVHYRDPGRAAAYDDVLARIPAREIFERTGVQVAPINTLYELAALASDPARPLESAETLLLIPDLLHHWLTGARSAEWTNATTTQCLDVRTGAWATGLLDDLGIPARLLPDAIAPGTSLGPLLPAVVDELGAAPATVIATATHDTAAAVAAVPFRHVDAAYISAGTWSLVGCELDEPRVDDATFAAHLTNEGGVAGTFRVLRNVCGLWLLHECRRAWAAGGSEYDFPRLVGLAEEAPPLRSLIDPDDPHFAAPGDVPVRIRDACAATGQPVPEGPGQIARCVLESLALRHAEAIAQLAAATGRQPTEIHVVGGGAHNALLCRWTAAAAGLPLLAGPMEASLIGNLLVQAIGLGELDSIAEGREVVRASFAVETYEPERSSAWSEARERFAALVAADRAPVEAVT
jgi:rhamnulokinase